MSVSNGQNANQTTFNNAFVSKTTDSTTVGKLVVNKPADGASVDVQVDINELKADVLALESATATYTTDAELAAHEADTSTHGVSTVAGLSETQVFTNKDYDGGTASNTSRVTLPKAAKATLDGLTRKEGTLLYATDEDKVYYDDGTTLTQVGSGAGSGGINHISANPDAEASTVGWVTFNDLAGTAPVDGTGGIPIALGFSRSTSSPLRSNANFLFDKSTPANAQGDGVGYAFTIARADRYSVHTIKFNYEVGSGTYADNDVSVWIYDVTNSTLIQPVGHQIKSTTVNATHQATFQTTDSTSYRLIFHVSSTSALGYALKFDDISVGPQSIARGPMVEGERATSLGTISVTATTTNPTKGTTDIDRIVFLGRYGQRAKLRYDLRFTGAGTSGSGDYLFTMPSGYSMDTTNMTLYTTLEGDGSYQAPTVIGYGEYRYAGGAGQVVKVMAVPYSSTQFRLAYTGQLSEGYLSSSVGFANASTQMSVVIDVPIQGWSSNQVLSSEEDGRVLACRVSGNPANATLANPIIAPTVDRDSHGIYNATTGRATLPLPGWYKIFGTLQTPTASNMTLNLYVNGSIGPVAGYVESGSGDGTFGVLHFASAGDIVDIRSTVTTDADGLTLNIMRLSGPSQIAASETIAARYTTTAAPTITTTLTAIIFGTRTYDSHGSFSGSTFTASVSGKFSVKAALRSSATFGSTINNQLAIYKNGAIYSSNWETIVTGCFGQWRVDDEVELLAGQTIQIFAAMSTSSSALSANAHDNFVSIVRVGN